MLQGHRRAPREAHQGLALRGRGCCRGKTPLGFPIAVAWMSPLDERVLTNNGYAFRSHQLLDEKHDSEQPLRVLMVPEGRAGATHSAPGHRVLALECWPSAGECVLREDSELQRKPPSFCWKMGIIIITSLFLSPSQLRPTESIAMLTK